MHDPSTVAFDIKYPWRSRPSKFWPKGHRDTFITIWHEDPLRFKGKCGCRDDDSCGWFRPPMTIAERDGVMKHAAEQYDIIFEKQARTREGASYAYICFEPTPYDAIYWIWRAIKYRGREGWMFGNRMPGLSAAELETIYRLARCPGDNLERLVLEVRDVDTFQSLFLSVYRAYTRFKRPWYRHPRWHVHHWSLQIHPLQKLKRRLFTRCCHCGEAFGWNESPTGSWGGDKVWHSKCDRSFAIRCEAVEASRGQLADANSKNPHVP